MKDFFRITKNKIIVGVILMVLNLASAWYSATAFLCTENCPTANSIQDALYPTIHPFLVIPFFAKIFINVTFIPEIILVTLTFVLSILALLAFWHTLACILVATYTYLDKIRQQ